MGGSACTAHTIPGVRLDAGLGEQGDAKGCGSQGRCQQPSSRMPASASASLFQRKGDDYNMEQISIIERFPYPFQVSPHCTPFASPLCLAAGCWGDDSRGTWGQTRHHCPSASCHSAILGGPAAVHSVGGRQVSLCKPRGIGQLYLRGLLRWKPALSSVLPLSVPWLMLEVCCLLAACSAPSPAACPSWHPVWPPPHRKSEKEVESLGGGGLIYNLSVMVPRAPCRASTHQHGLCSAPAAQGGHKPWLSLSSLEDPQLGH